MIEMQAVLTCDRCPKQVTLFNCDTEREAEQRYSLLDGWCDSEDGDQVCPECWKKWDAAQVAKAGEARTVDADPLSPERKL